MIYVLLLLRGQHSVVIRVPFGQLNSADPLVAVLGGGTTCHRTSYIFGQHPLLLLFSITMTLLVDLTRVKCQKRCQQCTYSEEFGVGLVIPLGISFSQNSLWALLPISRINFTAAGFQSMADEGTTKVEMFGSSARCKVPQSLQTKAPKATLTISAAKYNKLETIAGWEIWSDLTLSTAFSAIRIHFFGK